MWNIKASCRVAQLWPWPMCSSNDFPPSGSRTTSWHPKAGLPGELTLRLVGRITSTSMAFKHLWSCKFSRCYSHASLWKAKLRFQIGERCTCELADTILVSMHPHSIGSILVFEKETCPFRHSKKQQGHRNTISYQEAIIFCDQSIKQFLSASLGMWVLSSVFFSGSLFPIGPVMEGPPPLITSSIDSRRRVISWGTQTSGTR